MIKNLSKNIFLLLSIVSVFLITRIVNLTSLPVFGDEGIYIRWSQIIRSVETLRFIPLTDGKQPFFMWLSVPFLKIFSDPLFAVRLLSVFSGLGLMLAIIFTVSLIFHLPKSTNITTLLKNVFTSIPYHAFLAGILYILLPFSYFFDRLALADTLLSFFGVLALFFTILLAKYSRLDISLILGAVLGLSWLTKSPAIYFSVLSFFTFLVLNKKIRHIYLPIISILISQVIYSILRLGPQFHQIALRNSDYIWKLSDVLPHPFDPLIPHLLDTANIYQLYISIPIMLLFIFLNIKYFKTFKLYNFILIGWWLLPLISNSIFAKVYTARYVLYTLPPFIILLSTLLANFKAKYLLFLLLIPNIFTIYKLNTNPFGFKATSTELGYFQDWTSGWGIKPVADYLISRSKSANVIVGTEGYFGTLPDGLQIYTNNVPQLTVFGVGINLNRVPDKLIDAFNHGDEVYLLFNSSRLMLTPDQLYLVEPTLTFQKPNGDQLILYKLK